MRIFFLILLIGTQFYSQAQDDKTGIVYFGHRESFGMGAPIGVDYKAILIFNRTSATYIFAKDSLEGNKINEMKHFENNSKAIFLIQKATSEKGKIFNVDKKLNLVKSRDVGFHYVKDSIPTIKWEIKNETKQIGKFKCTKALGNFSGREYTVWFATSIPIPFGPWKLQGLPGLILEAYDTNKEVYFYFKSIEYPSNKNLKIEIPNPESEKKEWITYEEYKKAIIKRYRIGIKRGQLLSEQVPSTSSSENKSSMKNVFIEVFEK